MLVSTSTAQSISSDLKALQDLKPHLEIDAVDGKFLAISINPSAPTSGGLEFMFMGALMEQELESNPFDLMKTTNASWTTGELRVIGGTRYLVVYRLDITEVIFAADEGFESGGEPKLHLELVRLDSIKSLVPLLNLTPKLFRETVRSIFDGFEQAEGLSRSVLLPPARIGERVSS
jgi:hypothetical protein